MSRHAYRKRPSAPERAHANRLPRRRPWRTCPAPGTHRGQRPKPGRKSCLWGVRTDRAHRPHEPRGDARTCRRAKRGKNEKRRRRDCPPMISDDFFCVFFSGGWRLPIGTSSSPGALLWRPRRTGMALADGLGREQEALVRHLQLFFSCEPRGQDGKRYAYRFQKARHCPRPRSALAPRRVHPGACTPARAPRRVHHNTTPASSRLYPYPTSTLVTFCFTQRPFWRRTQASSGRRTTFSRRAPPRSILPPPRSPKPRPAAPAAALPAPPASAQSGRPLPAPPQNVSRTYPAAPPPA